MSRASCPRHTTVYRSFCRYSCAGYWYIVFLNSSHQLKRVGAPSWAPFSALRLGYTMTKATIREIKQAAFARTVARQRVASSLAMLRLVFVPYPCSFFSDLFLSFPAERVSQRSVPCKTSPNIPKPPKPPCHRHGAIA